MTWRTSYPALDLTRRLSCASRAGRSAITWHSPSAFHETFQGMADLGDSICPRATAEIGMICNRSRLVQTPRGRRTPLPRKKAALKALVRHFGEIARQIADCTAPRGLLDTDGLA
jgi:hypothetical protein